MKEVAEWGMRWIFDVHDPFQALIFRFYQLLSDYLNQIQHLIPSSTKILPIDRVAVYRQAVTIAGDPLFQEKGLVAVSLRIFFQSRNCIVIEGVNTFAPWHRSNPYPGIRIRTGVGIGEVVCSFWLP